MSIENPRQEADTPRMPNFWWCPTHHLYRGGTERPCADAVELGNVEALRLLLDQTVHAEMVAKQQLAEIRAVLADFEHCGPRTPVAMLRDITAILDREPGRGGAQ